MQDVLLQTENTCDGGEGVGDQGDGEGVPETPSELKKTSFFPGNVKKTAHTSGNFFNNNTLVNLI